MSSRVICLGVLASGLGFGQYIKPFDYNQYTKPFKPQTEVRRNSPVVIETPKACVIPLLEFKPQIRSRMPVIKPTAPTAPMPKIDLPPACPPRTGMQTEPPAR